MIKKWIVLGLMLALIPMVTKADSTQILNENNEGLIDYTWALITENIYEPHYCFTGTDQQYWLKFDNSSILIPEGNIIRNAYVSVLWRETTNSVNKTYTDIISYCLNQTWSSGNNQTYALLGCQADYNNTDYFGNKTIINKLVNFTVTGLVIDVISNASVSNITFMLHRQAYDPVNSNGFNESSLYIDYVNYTHYTDWSPCINYTQNRTYTYGYANITQNNTCYSGNTSYKYCHDNDTLITSNILLYNGNEYDLIEPTLCDNGCDNTTKSCNPNFLNQNLELIIVILLFFICLIILAYKVLK